MQPKHTVNLQPIIGCYTYLSLETFTDTYQL